MERLKDSMVRVKALVDFYQESPNIYVDMLDTLTKVTIGDLRTLLDGLEDREAIQLVESQEEWWSKGYDKGYEAGRDGEAKRVKKIIEKYVHELDYLL